MKKITVTYDVNVIEDDEEFVGETCINLSVDNGIAYNLVKFEQKGVAMHELEKTIVMLERLKGRTYIRGSIKDIRYDEEV